jgi:hypothetical protein
MYLLSDVVQCTYGRRSDDVMGLVASSVVFHSKAHDFIISRAQLSGRSWRFTQSPITACKLYGRSIIVLAWWWSTYKIVYVRYHGQLENFSWAVIVAIMELSACLFKLWIYCQSLLVIPLWSFSTNLTEWVQSVSCLSRQSIFNRL